MISINYVNGSGITIPAYDPFSIFESDVDSIFNDIDNAYIEYKEAMDEYNLSVEFFEAGDDNKVAKAAEKKTNFVDKIGNAIIEVGKKAIAFINNIITKIQESLFANKSDMQKISSLCKQNPSMTEEINKAFKEGNLQVADLKSIKELEAAYDEAMKLAKQQDVDPNTVKGKWLKAKKKFGNLGESDVVKGIAAVGIVATTAVTIAKLPEIIANFSTIKTRIKETNDRAALVAEQLSYEREAHAEKLRGLKADADKSEAEKERTNFLLNLGKKTEEDEIKKKRADAEIAERNLKFGKDTEEDDKRKKKADADKAEEDLKFLLDTKDNRRRDAALSPILKAQQINLNRKTGKNTVTKSKADATKAKEDAKFAVNTRGSRERKQKYDERKANYDSREARDNYIRKDTKRKQYANRNTNESAFDYLTFDEGGYMIESVSDGMRSVVAAIHADMIKVYMSLSSLNFKSISRAKAMLASAVKGYNKPLKKEEFKKGTNESDEESEEE